MATNIKLAAARELIREHHYEAARAVLLTIDHPTAHQWLARLDHLAPVPSPVSLHYGHTSAEQETYFRAENRARRRRRLGAGIELIVMAVFALAMAWFFGLQPSTVPGGPTVSTLHPVFALIAVGLVVLGIVLIRRRD